MATRASPPARKRAGGSEDGDVDPALPQKKRARHRLIGAIALCLLAAIVVPLLLDSEPSRPTTDVAIVIPSRDTPLPARAADAKPVEAKGGDTKSGDVRPADTKAADTKAAKAEPRTDGKDEIAQLADAAQARTKGEGRYLLQVGAYSNESGAASAVDRVQATGLRAFTEKIKTDRGDRVRVRVGPFTSRDAAEQARTQLQAAGVQAAMISP